MLKDTNTDRNKYYIFVFIKYLHHTKHKLIKIKYKIQALPQFTHKRL